MLKRIVDIVFSVMGLVILSPLLILIALMIRVIDGSPVLFRQIRAGRNCEPFTVFKFRTMAGETEDSGQSLPDGIRLTRLGRQLRKSSLDELPELWNVLKGDMSLVGPRPLLTRYLPFYTEEEMTRHSVRPGITGLAQVSGRNRLDWDSRLALDVEYVRSRSMSSDLKILLRTMSRALTGAGVAVDPSIEMKDLDEERKQAIVD